MASIHRSTQALLMVTDDRARADAFLESVAPRAAVAGPADAFAAEVERWAAVARPTSYGDIAERLSRQAVAA